MRHVSLTTQITCPQDTDPPDSNFDLNTNSNTACSPAPFVARLSPGSVCRLASCMLHRQQVVPSVCRRMWLWLWLWLWLWPWPWLWLWLCQRCAITHTHA